MLYNETELENVLHRITPVSRCNRHFTYNPRLYDHFVKNYCIEFMGETKQPAVS